MNLMSLFDGSGGFPMAGAMNGIEPIYASEVEPFPIAVTRSRFPQMEHLGDVSKVDGGTIKPVDVVTFGSPCFPAGTLVLTQKGLVEIENISVGDKVLTHKGRWRTVTATGSKQSNTILLKGNHGGLECTPNHPIYSYDLSGNVWIEAEKMLGKPWCVPTKIEKLQIPKCVKYENKNVKPLPKFSKEFFYFVGRWLGGGWVSNSQAWGRPTGQTQSRVYLCDSKDKLQELLKIAGYISDRCSFAFCGSCAKVKFTSKSMDDFLTKNFGKYALGKEIPSWALSLPKEYRISLLNGILDSDGYKKKKSYKVETVSKKLAFGIRLLAESLGKETRTYFNKRPPTCIIMGRKVNQHDVYGVEILETSSRYSDGIHRWYTVKSVSELPETKTVYNLTVDEDNSYTADGIVVHNCQDLSVAGKMAGLENGERSSLFFQAIRIIREMRNATNGKYPKYIVWENVCGAMHSNGGGDFRRVLEEFCRTADETASIPMPEKWEHAGEIVGDGYSVAWRVLDAQYWGVPQRRKRIFVVGCLTSECAGEILFKPDSVPWNTVASREAWQGTACTAERGITATGADLYNQNLTGDKAMCLTSRQTDSHHVPCVIPLSPVSSTLRAETEMQKYMQDVVGRFALQPFRKTAHPRTSQDPQGWEAAEKNDTLNVFDNSETRTPTVIVSVDMGGGKSNCGIFIEQSPTLTCTHGGTPAVAIQDSKNGILALSYDIGEARLRTPQEYVEQSPTVTARCGTGGNNVPAVVYDSRGNGNGNIVPTVTGDHNNRVTDYTAVVASVSHDLRSSKFDGEKADPLTSTDYKEPQAVCYTQSSYGFYPQMKAECVTMTEEKSATIVNGTNPGFHNGVITNNYTVRRLTPTECARLQGFPDWWCDGIGIADPSEEDMAFWRTVFDTYCTINGIKPKSDSQIRKFIQNPYSESAEYKMWGNGVALPCVYYILHNISQFNQK